MALVPTIMLVHNTQVAAAVPVPPPHRPTQTLLLTLVAKRTPAMSNVQKINVQKKDDSRISQRAAVSPTA